MKNARRIKYAALAALTMTATVAGCSSEDGEEPQTYAHPEIEFKHELKEAAAQCPDAISLRQIVSVIAQNSHWQTGREPSLHGGEGLAGYTPNYWESLGGGDPNDPATAIAAIATDVCGRAAHLREQVSAGAIHVNFGDIENLPAMPVDPELSAAAWGAYMGGEYVESHGTDVNDPHIGAFLRIVLDKGDTKTLD